MALNANGKSPIVRHPLFPGLIALWFAALLGLGSLAIRAGVLENLVLRLRIDALIPAAAPPLGFTARLLLASALALAGGLTGFVLARRLARGGAVPAVDAVLPDGAPLPVAAAARAGSVLAEADDNDDLVRLEAARSAPPSGRRRALPSESSLGIESPAILHLGELDHLDLAPPSAPDVAPDSALSAPAPEPEPEAAPALPEPAPEPPALPRASLEGLAIPDLLARFGQALAARGAARAAAPAGATQAAEVVPEPEAEPFAPFAPAESLVPAPEAGRPFDMPASLRQPGLGNIEWFDEEADEAAAAATLESLLPPKRPSTADPLRALGVREAGEADPDLCDSHLDDEAARWALPDPEGEPVDEDSLEDEPAEDRTFSSLLDLKPVVRTPPPIGAFVRVDEADAAPGEAIAEPVVTFPGQAVPPPPIPARLPGAPFGATPVETEAALREALAALQKMSGAA